MELCGTKSECKRQDKEKNVSLLNIKYLKFTVYFVIKLKIFCNLFLVQY